MAVPLRASPGSVDAVTCIMCIGHSPRRIRLLSWKFSYTALLTAVQAVTVKFATCRKIDCFVEQVIDFEAHLAVSTLRDYLEIYTAST